MQRYLAYLSPKYIKKTISDYILKQPTYCRQNVRKQLFTNSCVLASLPCLNIRCSCLIYPTTCRLLSGPFKFSARFSIALLTVFVALYISIFLVMITVVITGVISLQKANICMKYIFLRHILWR